MYLHTDDRFAAAQSAWLLASFYDDLSKMEGEDDDSRFIDFLIEMVSDRDVDNLRRLMDYYEKLGLAEMPAATEEQSAQADDEKESECAALGKAFASWEQAFAPSYPVVEVTKQSRKRDKKKKDDKRRDYAKYSYSPGAPRTKGDSEYVLPSKRSCGKRYMKRKVNHTVRRYKGYLPKGNSYRKMDPDLWMWW